MPTFDFTSPDGKSYSVDGPDGATPEQAFQILQQHLAQPSVGIGEDAAKSIGSGLASATIGTLGALGDLRGLASSGVDAAFNKLGVDLSPLKTAAKYSPLGILNAAPTSEDIRSTVKDPIVSPDYEPQYEFSRLLKKGAEFAPTALVGGPEGIGAKLLANVAAPAIGSEIGKQIAGPYGEAAGALTGGVGGISAARKFQEMAAARKAASAVPTGEDILKASKSGFTSAEDMNLVTAPDFATSAAAKIRSDLRGFDPETNPVFKIVDRLEALGAAPKSNMTPAQKLQAEMNWEATPPPAPASPVAMNDVELIREQLTKLKKSQDGPTREAARRAIESLQESQLNLKPNQVLNGDAAAYTSTMKNAIGDYATAKNWQTLNGKRNLAELNANSPVGMLDSAVGGQALQRTMKQLARPANNTDVPIARKLGFKPDEVAAITGAANGNVMQHAAEIMDRVIPAKLGAIPAMILRQIGGLSTKKQISALDSLVRSRSPHAQQVAAQVPEMVKQLPAKSQRLLRALILADPSLAQLAQQGGQPVGQPNTY